ncbi:hypothetical protein F2Q69_00030249 [Brassica cretica]|uniref:Uncharacterized protein n=1 Tax=Brassica cretica TaxID=69181 RepID=A0A8S9RZB4_BRACR|nr:hypothetical protein F2Q69_00030249 [Brassica cretica]
MGKVSLLEWIVQGYLENSFGKAVHLLLVNSSLEMLMNLFLSFPQGSPLRNLINYQLALALVLHLKVVRSYIPCVLKVGVDSIYLPTEIHCQLLLAFKNLIKLFFNLALMGVVSGKKSLRRWHRHQDQKLQPSDHLTFDLVRYADDPPGHAGISINTLVETSTDYSIGILIYAYGQALMYGLNVWVECVLTKLPRSVLALL